MATSKEAIARALAHGYRSGLEETVAAAIAAAGFHAEYEAVQLAYVKPLRPSFYKPDFILPNGIIIETKGRFTTEDRQKHKWLKDQHPKLDLRFVFSRSTTRLSKQSKTTYAAWCEKYGFFYADKLIPKPWMLEPVKQERLDAIKEAIKK